MKSNIREMVKELRAGDYTCSYFVACTDKAYHLYKLPDGSLTGICPKCKALLKRMHK